MRKKAASAADEINVKPARARELSPTKQRVLNIRLENTRAVVKRFGTTHVSKLLGHKNAAQLSALTGPNPSRDISDDMARRIEEVCGLPRFSLDMDPSEMPSSAPAPSPVAPAPSTEMLTAVIRAVGQACAEENVNPGVDKFADLATIAYTDAVEHGGAPRLDHIKMLVKLAR